MPISERLSEVCAATRISATAASPQAWVRISRRASSVRGPVMTWTRWIPSRSAANTQIGRKTTNRWTYSPGASGGLSDRKRCAAPTWASCASKSAPMTSATYCTSSSASSDFVARHAALSGGPSIATIIPASSQNRA